MNRRYITELAIMQAGIGWGAYAGAVTGWGVNATLAGLAIGCVVSFAMGRLTSA